MLWGPHGSGKTSLALLMADAFNADFLSISAVLAGVKDIREAVAHAEAALAQSGRHTILFVDEVHRFNKAQQDAFLPFVEQGLLTFIGATTQNPSFEVISALLSRVAVYVLTSLSPAELGLLFDRAAKRALPGLTFDESARERVIGSPEGELALAQCVIYLACAAKSNAVYVAYDQARGFVGNDESRPVPAHLRNAPTRLMKQLGFGRDYRYAHDEQDAYAAGENYFPEDMPEVKWYEPTDRGLEAKIVERLAYLRGLDGQVKKKK